MCESSFSLAESLLLTRLGHVSLRTVRPVLGLENPGVGQAKKDATAWFSEMSSSIRTMSYKSWPVHAPGAIAAIEVCGTFQRAINTVETQCWVFPATLHCLGPNLNRVVTDLFCSHLIRRYSVMFPHLRCVRTWWSRKFSCREGNLLLHVATRDLYIAASDRFVSTSN